MCPIKLKPTMKSICSIELLSSLPELGTGYKFVVAKTVVHFSTGCQESFHYPKKVTH